MKTPWLAFLFSVLFMNHAFAQVVTATDPNKGGVVKKPGEATACYVDSSWFDCKVDRVNVYTDRITVRCAGGTGYKQSAAIAKSNAVLAEQFLSLATSAFLSGSKLPVYRSQSNCPGETTGVPGCDLETCSRATAFSISRP